VKEIPMGTPDEQMRELATNLPRGRRFRVEFLEDGVLLLDVKGGTVSRCTWEVADAVRRGEPSGLEPELHAALRRALMTSGATVPRPRRDVLRAAAAASVVASSTLILPSAAQAASVDLVAGAGWVTGTQWYQFNPGESGGVVGTIREISNGEETVNGSDDQVSLVTMFAENGFWKTQLVMYGVNGAPGTNSEPGGTGMTLITNLSISENSDYSLIRPVFGLGGTGGGASGKGGAAAGAYLVDDSSFLDTGVRDYNLLWIGVAAGGGGAGAQTGSTAFGLGYAGGSVGLDRGGDGGGADATMGGRGAVGTTPGAAGVGTSSANGATGTSTPTVDSQTLPSELGRGGNGNSTSTSGGGGGGAGWAGGGGGGGNGDGPSGGGGAGSPYVASHPIVVNHNRIRSGLAHGSLPEVRVYY